MKGPKIYFLSTPTPYPHHPLSLIRHSVGGKTAEQRTGFICVQKTVLKLELPKQTRCCNFHLHKLQTHNKIEPYLMCHIWYHQTHFFSLAV